MPSYIDVNLAGHLGQDPEVRYSASGTAFANLSVAVNYKVKDEEKTEWVRCTVFKSSAEQCAHLKKGDLVHIRAGRLQTNKWQDSNGNDRYTTEVVGGLLIPGRWVRTEQSQESAQESAKDSRSQGGRGTSARGSQQDFDDDIPF